MKEIIEKKKKKDIILHIEKVLHKGSLLKSKFCLTLDWEVFSVFKMFLQCEAIAMWMEVEIGKYGSLQAQEHSHHWRLGVTTGCLAAGDTGPFNKTDAIMRKEPHVQILKYHLKTSARKLKVGHKGVFQITVTIIVPLN